MAAHEKLGPVKKMREVTDYLMLMLPLPKINPNIVSGLSIIASLAFVFAFARLSVRVSFVFLMLALLFDWFDGLIAKKHNLATENGYVVDVASDRISEAIIFIPFFNPWFYLFAVNMVLTMLSFVKNKHVILPLRFIFAIYFYLYML